MLLRISYDNKSGLFCCYNKYSLSWCFNYLFGSFEVWKIQLSSKNYGKKICISWATFLKFVFIPTSLKFRLTQISHFLGVHLFIHHYNALFYCFCGTIIGAFRVQSRRKLLGNTTIFRGKFYIQFISLGNLQNYQI